ncbi:MAG: hypothetical protein AB7Q42_16745 [Acidimicrobiia bacterium]
MFKFVRRLASPFTRTAIMMWSWNHRHEIQRWGRSIWTELRAPGSISPARLKTLGSILWRVSRDPQLTNAPQLRSVALVGDVVELDVDPTWKHAPHLMNELRGVAGVTEVSVRSA